MRLHEEEMNDNLITLKRLLYAWMVKVWDVLECSRPPKHHKWKEIEYAKPKQMDEQEHEDEFCPITLYRLEFNAYISFKQ